jgi:hypothetical protein
MGSSEQGLQTARPLGLDVYFDHLLSRLQKVAPQLGQEQGQ